MFEFFDPLLEAQLEQYTLLCNLREVDSLPFEDRKIFANSRQLIVERLRELAFEIAQLEEERQNQIARFNDTREPEPFVIHVYRYTPREVCRLN